VLKDAYREVQALKVREVNAHFADDATPDSEGKDTRPE
jgi:hypothetical protein